MQCQPAVASMSLGSAAAHELQYKLDQAKTHGFKGIELCYEDLEQFAASQAYLNNDAQHNSEDTIEVLVAAALSVKRLCDERGLTIVALQPFRQYEGLKDRQEYAKKIAELKIWIASAKALQTTVILMPSTFLPVDQLNPDLNAHIADLMEAADLCALETPPIRIIYESVAWGTYINTWEQSWEVCEKVNRPNFGIVLDTFNIAARVFADPAIPGGTVGLQAEEELKKSIQRMIKTIDLSKVYFIQVADAECLQNPLRLGHEFYVVDQPARMSWSRNCRLFYGERSRGAYLPIYEILHAILDKADGLGFVGWVSMEVFSRTLAESGPEVPKEHAERAANAWRQLVKDFHL